MLSQSPAKRLLLKLSCCSLLIPVAQIASCVIRNVVACCGPHTLAPPTPPPPPPPTSRSAPCSYWQHAPAAVGPGPTPPPLTQAPTPSSCDSIAPPRPLVVPALSLLFPPFLLSPCMFPPITFPPFCCFHPFTVPALLLFPPLSPLLLLHSTSAPSTNVSSGSCPTRRCMCIKRSKQQRRENSTWRCATGCSTWRLVSQHGVGWGDNSSSRGGKTRPGAVGESAREGGGQQQACCAGMRCRTGQHAHSGRRPACVCWPAGQGLCCLWPVRVHTHTRHSYLVVLSSHLCWPVLACTVVCVHACMHTCGGGGSLCPS